MERTMGITPSQRKTREWLLLILALGASAEPGDGGRLGAVEGPLAVGLRPRGEPR